MPKRSRARQEMLYTIFVTALEGGINYWASVESYSHNENNFTARATINEIGDGWGEDDIYHNVNCETIAAGLNLISKSVEYKTFAARIRKNLKSFDDFDLDADDCDAILQMGIFGEIVYG